MTKGCLQTGMRLLYHYHVPVGASADGSLVTSGVQGRFIESLAGACAEVYLAAYEPRPDDITMDYRVAAKNVQVVGLGAHCSVPRRLALSFFARRAVSRIKGKIDCALLRGPSPLLPQVYSALRPVPTAMLIVGDYLEGIDFLPQPSWRKQLIRVWARWNAQAQWRAAGASLVFVNSHSLYEKYHTHARSMIEIRTTNLSRGDGFVVEDRCRGEVTRLLYAGRIDAAKGIFELIAAAARLRDENRNVHLDIVGGCARGDSTGQKLMDFIKAKNAESFVRFHGHKAFGEELFEYYRNADIFLLPSYAEGFPRAIWEAMAFCVPVIASRVGSIPHYLGNGDEALLVPPRDSDALAAAVVRLMDQPTLRRKLIARGRQLAAENVLEAGTLRLVRDLEKHVAAS